MEARPGGRSAPTAAIRIVTRVPAGRSRAARRRHRVAWYRVGLACAVALLRSRRFHERMIAGVIGVAALAGLARQSQARAVERLAAWDQQRMRQETRKAKIGRDSSG